MALLYDFCKSQGVALPKRAPRRVLFHGSRGLHTTLTPHVSIGRSGKTEKEHRVYATDDPNYAVFLAVLDLKNGSAAVHASPEGTALAVDLEFVNGPSQLKSGYVHLVAARYFKKADNREYTANRPVEVLCAIPVIPADLTVPIHIQIKPRQHP